VATWTFLTNHGRALLCIAGDPEIRLRDIAVALGITERRAYGIVNDLTEAGYVTKEKEGRRNRYHVQEHLPLPEAPDQEHAIGGVLSLMTGRTATPRPRGLARS
jgi:DNA-binding transcriptional ArsR family regulator